MNPQLDPERLPRHVAVIMDGNGRWAKERNRKRVFGHREGSNSVRDIVTCCRRIGIPYLTLYALSKENLQRPEGEVKALWRLLKSFLKSQLPEMIEKEIRLVPSRGLRRHSRGCFATTSGGRCQNRTLPQTHSEPGHQLRGKAGAYPSRTVVCSRRSTREMRSGRTYLRKAFPATCSPRIFPIPTW